MDKEVESVLNAIAIEYGIPVNRLLGILESNDWDDRVAMEKYLNAQSAEQKILFQKIQDICIHRTMVSKRRASRFNRPKARR